MNNQPKRGDSAKNIAPFSAEEESVAPDELPKRKRGRPKTSPHDAATQNRLRVQRHRDAMKEEEAVRVDVYLPKAWHDWLLNVKRANLREVAVEAFALWLEKHGYPADAAAKSASAKEG